MSNNLKNEHEKISEFSFSNDKNDKSINLNYQCGNKNIVNLDRNDILYESKYKVFKPFQNDIIKTDNEVNQNWNLKIINEKSELEIVPVSQLHPVIKNKHRKNVKKRYCMLPNQQSQSDYSNYVIKNKTKL